MALRVWMTHAIWYSVREGGHKESREGDGGEKGRKEGKMMEGRHNGKK